MALKVAVVDDEPIIRDTLADRFEILTLHKMKKIFLLISLAFTLGSTGQTEIRMMSYNLLNFPTGNLEGRVDTLNNILDYYRPHLFMIQELKTAQGLSDVTDRLNDLGYGSFDHGTFVPQVSSGIIAGSALVSITSFSDYICINIKFQY